MTIEELRSHVDAVLPEIVALRHDLHSHPELSGGEERTASVVSEWLTRAGIPHETGIGGGYGIVGVIEGNASGGKTFALRGDMDALPIVEENEVPYKSLNPGVMHACGHDGHTANLMGAALVLNRVKDQLPGRVKLLFQPAEETVNGAESMVRGGALKDVEAILMLHGWPDLGVGQIGVRTGPVMASADIFTVTLTGRGGHGAYPHRTIDPIVAGAEIISVLQTVVAREVSPTAPAVVSVTNFNAGTGAYNVIPEKAELKGTVRALDKALRDSMPERVERVVAGVAKAMRCEYTFTYGFGTPVTVNDAAVIDLVREVGRDVLGSENVVELTEPTMGAEDFAYYLEHVPGAMFRLGTDCPYHLHTPKYDFGDGPLPHGVLLMVEAARRFLAE